MLPAIAFNVLFLIKVIIGSTWITFLGWIVLMVESLASILQAVFLYKFNQFLGVFNQNCFNP